jgi:hypothetical protein
MRLPGGKIAADGSGVAPGGFVEVVEDTTNDGVSPGENVVFVEVSPIWSGHDVAGVVI